MMNIFGFQHICPWKPRDWPSDVRAAALPDPDTCDPSLSACGEGCATATSNSLREGVVHQAGWRSGKKKLFIRLIRNYTSLKSIKFMSTGLHKWFSFLQFARQLVHSRAKTRKENILVCEGVHRQDWNQTHSLHITIILPSTAPGLILEFVISQQSTWPNQCEYDKIIRIWIISTCCHSEKLWKKMSCDVQR